MILEKLIVPLLGDISKFKSSMTEAEGVAGKSTANIANRLDSIGSSVQKIGAVGTAAITVPLAALGKESISAASDLNESLNKVQVVFGDTSNSVVEFTKTANTNLGMSQQAALAATGMFGSLFTTMGLGKPQMTEMSLGLTQIATDMGSFHNVDPTDMLDKLRAGMTGEAEPLKQFGLDLSATAVHAKAMELGLADANGELSNAALATARYQLILDQTKISQGDFANTSDSLSNQMRITNATFIDLKAQIGQELIPVATQFLQTLLPIIQGFNNLDPETKKTIVTFGGIIAIIPPVIGFLGTLASGVSSLITLFGAGGGLAGVGTFLSSTVLPAIGAAISAVGWPVIAVIAVVGALIFIFIKFGDEIKATMTQVWSNVQQYLGNVANFLSGTLTSAFNRISSVISSVIGWVQRLAASFANLVIPSWLRPGSPTPLEIGIKGIGSAMKKASQTALPEFSSELKMQAQLNPVSAGYGASNSEIVRLLNNINDKKEIDENLLARAMRDSFLQMGLV